MTINVVEVHHRFRGGPLYWEDRCLVCSRWRGEVKHTAWWKVWKP